MTRVYLTAHPWAVPGYLVIGLLAMCAAPVVAARTNGGTARWWAFLTSTGGFVAVDLSPAAGHSGWTWSTHVVRSWAVDLPSARELAGLHDSSVNLAIALPVGLSAVLLARALRRRWPLAVVALPPLCELLQGAAPGLGRHGFLMTDLVLNEIGIAIGAAIGAGIGAVLARGVLSIPRRAR